MTLAGTSTGTTPTFTWTPLAAGSGTFSNPTIANPVYTAPVVAGANKVVNVSVTATNACGTSTSAISTITVTASLAPIVGAIAPQTVVTGNSGTFAVTATDPNVPTSQPLTWTVTQTPGVGAQPLNPLTVTANGPLGANVSYKAPGGVVAPPKVVTVTLTAKNAAGVSSAPVSTTVTINPLAAGVPPVANAGGPYTVNSGASVTLAGSATGTAPLTFLWAALPAGSGTLSSRNIFNPVYTAPVVAVDTVVNLSLTVSGVAPSSTATSSILVRAAQSPTLNPVAPVSVLSGAAGSFTVTGADPNTPALLPLTFTVTQVAPVVLPTVTQTRLSPTSIRVNFTAPVLPVGQIAPSTAQLTITAANSFGKVSLPQTTTVTVNPIPDSVAITTADFRTGKQRLIITATDTVVSPNIILTLQPYLTTTGVVFDPATLGNTLTNGGAGLYTMTLVGAPQPAAGPVLVVKSNLGGISPGHALDSVRP